MLQNIQVKLLQESPNTFGVDILTLHAVSKKFPEHNAEWAHQINNARKKEVSGHCSFNDHLELKQN